ncbi:pyridoxine 5'-phosphate oxidase C-terminal domain-containing protein [Streptomyces sp. NPDC088817]|uniref:pyridoxine 5'-phosphate oxidase C-terminal domain-containing protein n=1 Tax=unclassified Streptomyces TaxID=2593676 RepID=UPI0037FFAD6F
MEASLTRVKNEPDLVAPGWTLYSMCRESVEFWQGDRQRRHTRLVHVPSPDGWSKQMLWP